MLLIFRNSKVFSNAASLEEAKDIISRHKNEPKAVYTVQHLDQDKMEKIKRCKAPKKGEDLEFSKWLSNQACVITQRRGPRGVGPNNIHCHHIFGRGKGLRNDTLQVPLIGNVHSWGDLSLHSCSEDDFKKFWEIEHIKDLKAYFVQCALVFYESYYREMRS